MTFTAKEMGIILEALLISLINCPCGEWDGRCMWCRNADELSAKINAELAKENKE